MRRVLGKFAHCQRFRTSLCDSPSADESQAAHDLQRAVTGAAQGAQFLLNLAYIMVLARLLVPQDFGLVAMVTTVTGFLRIFQDAGLSTATVQRQEITHAQVSNLFWVNVGRGRCHYSVRGRLAPVIAWFYHEPRLIGITLVLSITFLLASSTVQHVALLNRQMRFGVIAVIDVISMLAGYLTGIGMALWKYGYWSLVVANVWFRSPSGSCWRGQFRTGGLDCLRGTRKPGSC